jgi:hypothetical protein
MDPTCEWVNHTEIRCRKTAEGKSKKEAMRWLKRYIARETYRAILLDAGARILPG